MCSLYDTNLLLRQLKLFFSVMILVVLSSTFTVAQTPKFWHLSVEQGLSNATVNCMLQDRQGFMWFGTDDGLNRYDGYQFRVFKKNAAKPNSLSDNLIESICEDGEGNIWIATPQGLDRYIPSLNQIEKIKEVGNLVIFALFLDDKGNLWISGNNRFGRLDIKTKRWDFFEGFFEGAHIFGSIAQTSPDDFWVSSNGRGMYHFHLPTKKTTHFAKKEKDANSLTDNTIHKLFYDKKETLWITTFYGGISRYNLKNKQFTTYRAEEGNPNTILTNGAVEVCQDGENLLFTIENGGLSRYNSQTNTFTNFVHDEKNPYSVISNTVRSIYKDRQGRIWVGTFSKGLSIWDRYKEKFFRLPIPLSNSIVNSLWIDRKERLWIGTEEGIALQDHDNISYFKYNPKNADGISANPILRIHEDTQGRMWFGSWLGGVNLLNEKERKFEHFLNQKNINSAGTANLNCVFAFANMDEQMLVASYGGLHLLDEKSKKFENLVEKLNIDIRPEYIHALKQDSKGNWWIATLNGLHFFDIKTRKTITYLHNPKDSLSISSDAMLCITEDSKHRLWFGSREGINLMELQGKFQHFTTADGLPNNEILSITEDKKGRLWLATSQGLSCFDVEKKTFKNYFESDGLVSKQFKINSATQNKNGEILLGTINGINVFHPDSVRDNPNLPVVVFTDFKVFNKSISVGAPDSLLKKDISHTQAIILTHTHSVFTLDFVALNFTQSEKNQYAYRLAPFEQEWNKVGSQRNATYTNLDAGTYVFHVKASNNDGVWNEESTRLTITILPPWWATWWFRALVLGTVIGGSFTFYSVRVRFLQKQNQKLEKLVNKRTKDLESANEELVQQKEELEQSSEFVQLQAKKLTEINTQKDKLFSIIAHDLRSPMGALKNSIEILDPDILTKGELDVIKKELIKQFKATDETLQNLLHWARSQMQGEIINPISLRISVIADETIEFLAKIASKKKIKLKNEINPAVEVLADKNHLQTIFRNLISNALKFTNKKGEIIISSKDEGKNIQIAVKDTGVGMTEAEKNKLFTNLYYTTKGTEGEGGSGLGLTLVKDLVEKNGGTIRIESEVGKGSTFYFTLPKA